MPHYYLNKKERVEDCLTLSVFFLNRNGAFKTSNSGVLSWSSALGSTSYVAYEINVDSLTPYIKIDYSLLEDQNHPMNISQKFYLSKTRCNFGGNRYWIICNCERRVAFLYKPYVTDNFKCRYCHDLTYESRNLSGNLKKAGKPLSIPDLLDLEMLVKRKRFYKGKLTKKHSKLLTKIDQFDAYHTAWFDNFMKKAKK